VSAVAAAAAAPADLCTVYTLCTADTTYKYSFIHKITYDTETYTKRKLPLFVAATSTICMAYHWFE